MSATTLKSGTNMVSAIKAGAVAGLAGGVVFGMLMAMMNMLPMVGMLVGQANAFVGLLVHMAISAFIGAVYGIVASRLPQGWLTALIGGMVNGLVWWVLGALILMPLGLGMVNMVLVIGATQWMSLMGHLIYGVITALVYVPLGQRL